MNTPSPLIPQGATPPRAKSSLYFKILMVLSVHVVVIGGMLVQGCNNTKDQAKQDKQDGSMLASTDTGTTAPASTVSTPVTAATGPATVPTADVTPITNPSLSNNVFATTPAPTTTGAPLVPPGSSSLVPPVKSTDLTAPTPAGDAREYAIAKGDTLGAIARRNGISLKALMEANPNVNAKKLQIGQKVQIPAATAALATTSKDGAAGAATGDVASDRAVYVVKPGDMLLKIAKAHGTTVKKIMAMNELKSTSIRAGQKLKLPAPKTTSTAEPSTATASTTVASLPAVTPVRNPALGSPVAAN